MKIHEEATAHLAKADKTLAKIIKKVGPCTLKIERRKDVFSALAQSIIYQQLSGKAAGTIHAKLLALLPARPAPEDFLALTEVEFRSVGISRNKYRALVDLAAKTAAGELPDRKATKTLLDAEVVDALTGVHGVGQWTVEMLMMFTLGRPDVLPATDYGVRKGFQKVYGTEELPPPKDILAFGERWRPFRTVASWYLWRSLEI